MSQPHTHKDHIIAWANGEKIQFLAPNSTEWVDCPLPGWSPRIQYRIKPEPKPDVVLYGYIQDVTSAEFNASITAWIPRRTDLDNIKATFNGETWKLKSVEVL